MRGRFLRACAALTPRRNPSPHPATVTAVRPPRRTLSLALLAASIALAAIPTVTCARGRRRHRSAPSHDVNVQPAAPSASLEANAFRYRQLAIGQGDSALLETGDGHAALVDTGPESGAEALATTVKSLGKRLDFILISHGHVDHYGGLRAAVGAGNPESFIVPHAPEEGVEWARTLAWLRASGARVVEGHVSSTLSLGASVGITVLAPSTPAITRSRSDVNANGLAVRIDHHGATYTHRFLMTGDAELETEARLLDSPESLKADVLKVAHHGSAFSSSLRFLEAVAPAYALVSAGKGNDYHHPHGAALERILGVGARILRTDVHGTITVTSRDAGLEVATEHEAADHAENVGADGGEEHLPKRHRPRHKSTVH